jgi:hypothetical protein
MGVIHHMMLLLAREVESWEEQLSICVQEFVSSDRVLEKERFQIQTEWKRNCRERLGTDFRAMGQDWTPRN